MQIILNEQGFVDAYALVGSFSSDYIEVDEPEDIQDFEDNCHSYYVSKNNKLIKNNEKLTEITEERFINKLRCQREKQCFPYINRGELWYNQLTDEQKTELAIWYKAWLDVTETKVMPTKPEWLN